jgi:hypothetical protein
MGLGSRSRHIAALGGSYLEYGLLVGYERQEGEEGEERFIRAAIIHPFATRALESRAKSFAPKVK